MKTKDELLQNLYRSTLLLRYDDIGTTRTGKEWFNRYMIHPWEKNGFELVEVSQETPRLAQRKSA